jgi:hypothetical protein
MDSLTPSSRGTLRVGVRTSPYFFQQDRYAISLTRAVPALPQA